MTQIVVCALYKFVHLNDFKALQQPLLKTMIDHHVKGTLLLAHEGINGTIAAPQSGIDAVLYWLKSDERLADLEVKISLDKQQPFYRTKVKLKKEIVTFGVADINPNEMAGTYVKPKDWNDLISDPEVTLIDTRNDYEVSIGSFKSAINPQTETFRQFPSYVKENLDSSKHKKIAMYCTGGIRCEKSTAYLKQQGFDEVYHLQGGILKYLEEVPENESLWEGDCFVFDNRVAVNHSLDKGDYDQCHACRFPITEEDKKSPKYVSGISCPKCFDKHAASQIRKFTEREKQIQLAKARGEEHIGIDAFNQIEINREKKKRLKLENKSNLSV